MQVGPGVRVMQGELVRMLALCGAGQNFQPV